MSPTALALIALLVIAASVARWFQLARAVRLPANRTGFALTWAAGTLLGCVALFLGPGWGGGLAAGVAVFVGGSASTSGSSAHPTTTARPSSSRAPPAIPS